MKKFISFVALATLLFSAIGCREAEQISDFSENQESYHSLEFFGQDITV